MKKRIIFTNEDGSVAVIIPAGAIEDCIKDVPEGKLFEIVDAADIPSDRTFRNAWEQAGKTIVHNLGKCKTIAHDKRREARAQQMAPLDIESTIPAKAQAAEAAREVIRQRFAQMQISIDAATTPDGIKAAMSA